MVMLTRKPTAKIAPRLRLHPKFVPLVVVLTLSESDTYLHACSVVKGLL